MTNHANIRSQQRGFTPFIIETILECGELADAPGGVIKIHLGNKEYQQAISQCKRFIQLLDKAKGGSLIVDGDQVITLYKQKSIRRRSL